MGEYLVVASEVGSRKYHPYVYGLFTIRDDKLVNITEEINVEKIKEDPARGISEKRLARAANSTLYAFALHIYSEMTWTRSEDDKAAQVALLAAEAEKLHKRLTEIQVELLALGVVEEEKEEEKEEKEEIVKQPLAGQKKEAQKKTKAPTTTLADARAAFRR
jgi:hypothetical protein